VKSFTGALIDALQLVLTFDCQRFLLSSELLFGNGRILNGVTSGINRAFHAHSHKSIMYTRQGFPVRIHGFRLHLCCVQHGRRGQIQVDGAQMFVQSNEMQSMQSQQMILSISSLLHPLLRST
jgi:hypothetical protein